MSDDIQAVKNLLYRIGSEVVNEAKSIAPYQTGNLKRDIQVFTDDIDDLEISIGNTNLAPYSIFVHQGTGIYGEHKQRITPKNKKALRTPYGLKRSVAGQKAQPYLTEGLDNYVDIGGLDRAVEDAGEEISEDIAKDIKKAFGNAVIK